MHRLQKMLLAFALITCLPIPCCAQSASEKKAAQKAELLIFIFFIIRIFTVGIGFHQFPVFIKLVHRNGSSLFFAVLYFSMF